MHSNVRAIREETTTALREYELLHRHWRPEVETEDDHTLRLGFIRGVIHEFQNCDDAGRVWTGNWSSEMIHRLQDNANKEIISRKQCRRLRTT